MTASTSADDEERTPPSEHDPASLVPEESVLEFEEYVDMLAAVGDPTRFRILYYLASAGETSPSELETALDIRGNRLHYHLETLLDAGLVEKWARSTADDDGLFTHYEASTFGEAILQTGIVELMETESEYREMYGDDPGNG